MSRGVQAELAKQAELARQAEAKAPTVAQSSSAPKIEKETPVNPPPQTTPTTPDTNQSWFDRNWKWILVGLGVIVAAKVLGIIKFS